MWKNLFKKKKLDIEPKEVFIIEKEQPLSEKLKMTTLDIELVELIEDLIKRGKVNIIRQNNGVIRERYLRKESLTEKSFKVSVGRRVFTLTSYLTWGYYNYNRYDISNVSFSSREINNHYVKKWIEEIEEQARNESLNRQKAEKERALKVIEKSQKQCISEMREYL